MDSIINQKKRLHQTLLSFPPFFTYNSNQLACNSTKSREESKQDTGENQSSYIANSKSKITEAQHHKYICVLNMEFSYTLGQVDYDIQYQINKIERLSKEDTLVVLKDLATLGCLDLVVGSQKILVSHFSPYEMADDMYRWASQNFLLGDVQTLQFITEGEQTTSKEKFYKQPKEIILKVLDVLQKQNKAVRIEIGSDIGVKFLK